MNTLSPSQETKFLIALTDLIESADDFTQLGLLASACDMLYPYTDPVHQVLFEKLEKTARHLRGLPVIGKKEISK